MKSLRDDHATAGELKRLFLAARRLAPAARAAYLEQTCAGNPALRKEVEDLLRYDVTEDGFLACPAIEHLAAELVLAPSRDLIGQQLGPYRIEAELGHGGMGEVYRAIDQRLGRAVAIKVLPAEFTLDEERVRRFEREARAISALKHPNIVTLFELFSHEGRQMLVTEYVEGETLREVLARGTLDWREAVRIATQVAAALAAAHSAGIIHRDIKPANVMRQTGQAAGHIKVLDFGIAKMRNHEPASQATHEQENTPAPQPAADHTLNLPTATGAILGTPGYLSPEQASFHLGAQPDERADVFSLGVLLYEMLTGQLPFPGVTTADKLNAILSPEEAPDVRAVLPNLPAALSAILSKALRKDPVQRYANGRELWAELEELTHDSAGNNPVKAKQQQRAQHANRLLTQFTALFLHNPATRIPPAQLWAIALYANLKPGKPERMLVRRSWLTACWRVWRVALPVGLLTLLVMAFFSVEEQWNERIMWDSHRRSALQVALAPDEQTLVSVSRDSSVIVWGLPQRKRRATLAGHTKGVSAVAYAPKGEWFATAGADGQVIVWDAACFTKAAVLPGSQREPDAVQFTPNGRLLLVPAKTPLLYEVGTWRNVGQVQAASSSVISPDSRLLVEGIWHSVELSTGRDFTSCAEPGWGRAALSPDGTRLATVDTGGYVAFWDVSRMWSAGEHRLLERLPAHRDHGRAVAYSPDGRLVATGSEEIIMWDAITHTKLARFAYKDLVNSLVFTRDGRQLISAHGGGAILIWDLAEKTVTANLAQHCGPVHAVSFSPDGQTIASASDDHSVILWNAQSGLKRGVLLGHQAPLVAVAFAHNSQTLASCDMYGNAILWDAQTQTEIRRFATLRPLDTSLGYCAALSPDGRWLATTFGVYDTASGQPLVRFSPPADSPSSEIHGVAFSPDGRWLVCVATSGFVYLWEVAHWRLQQTVIATGNGTTVDFSPDSHWLVTGSGPMLRLWQVEPLREVGVLGSHKADIASVAFSPNGNEVVSASNDETIALWNVPQRRFITNVGLHKPSVLAAAFSPDGRQIVSGEYDHSVRLYTRQRALWGRKLD